jgi:hypothetical protein
MNGVIETVSKTEATETNDALKFIQGDYIESSKVLGRCLEILGRPLPTSRLDMICSLLWHIFRQIVHRVLDTRWLAAKAIQWFSLRNTDEKCIEYRQESAKQAALVYHQLHQLYLTGIFLRKLDYHSFNAASRNMLTEKLAGVSLF